MHHTLKAFTDAGTFVRFDPGSVRHILRGEITLKEFDLDREVDEGRVLAYSTGDDGDALVRVYVGETPEKRIENHAEQGIDGVLLHDRRAGCSSAGRTICRPLSTSGPAEATTSNRALVPLFAFRRATTASVRYAQTDHHALRAAGIPIRPRALSR